MKKTMIILVMLLVLGTMSVTANATGVINLWLTNPTATTYEVYAQMDKNDGFGISLLGFDVSNVTSITNWMPYATYMDPDDNACIVGLGFLRSQSTAAQIVAAGGVGSVTASQDGITGTGVLILGMGQYAGDLSSYTSPNKQTIYGCPLLVAKGNRDSAAAAAFLSGAEGNANYYTSTGFDSAAATIVYGAPTPAVPEPSSMIALGSGVLGLFGLIRRKRS